ncbi:hypothetical protein GGF46_001715 [Coemansia sp. RSA 552]|nr:hypothetical protein GGF46_001715 [Coemansia sp. RSA 552]
MSTAATNIDDLDFPKAILTRMIKASLPEHISVQKEARNAVTKAATVFVNYLAATANDCAREAGHKNIMSADVMKALEAVGLADFIEQLKVDLEAHTRLAKEKKDQAAKEKAAAESHDDEGNDTAPTTAAGGHDDAAEEVPEQTDPAQTAAAVTGDDASPPPRDGPGPDTMDIDDPEAKRQRTE